MPKKIDHLRPQHPAQCCSLRPPPVVVAIFGFFLQIVSLTLTLTLTLALALALNPALHLTLTLTLT